MKILITDAEMEASLPFIRSLGEKGHKIYTTPTKEKMAAGSYSKYAKKLNYEDIDFNEFDFIIPVSDEMTEFFVNNPEYNALVPNKKDYYIARDKYKTLKLAEEKDIPHPRTIYIEKYDDVDIDFPVITKPTRDKGSRGVCLSKNREELRKNIDGTEGNVIAQEFIPYGGKNYCVDMIFLKDEMIAMYMTEIHRTYPVYGGPDVLTETIYDEKLKEYAERLMSGLHWNGIINIEFKENPENGELYLLEINPRPSSSIGISLKAGIDMPDILLKAFRGEDIKQFDYRKNILYKDTYNSILHFIENPKKWEVMKENRNFNGSVSNIEVKDIKPHMAQLGYVFKHIFSKEFRRRNQYINRTTKDSKKNMKKLYKEQIKNGD
ncbi:MAG: ATP-grasp domain-containing protein [Nanobdellota archaeon]